VPHPPTLEQALGDHPDVNRVQGVLFEHLEHLPSGTHLQVGFRCFACDGAALLDAFASHDPDALAALPPAVDEQGAPVPGLVRLDLAWSEDGTLAGCQPVRYVDYRPVPAAPAALWAGEAAQRWAAALRALDQQAR
jgi:hypothetical protein